MTSPLHLLIVKSKPRHAPMLLRHCLQAGEARHAATVVATHPSALGAHPDLVEEMITSRLPWALRLVATTLDPVPADVAHRVATARRNRDTWTILADRADLAVATQKLLAEKGTDTVRAALLRRRDLDPDVRTAVALSMLVDGDAEDRDLATARSDAARHLHGRWAVRRQHPTLMPGGSCVPSLRRVSFPLSDRWLADASVDELIAEFDMAVAEEMAGVAEAMLRRVLRGRPDAAEAVQARVAAMIAADGTPPRGRQRGLNPVGLFCLSGLTPLEMVRLAGRRWRSEAVEAAVAVALDGPVSNQVILELHEELGDLLVGSLRRFRSAARVVAVLEVILPLLPDDGLSGKPGVPATTLVDDRHLERAAGALDDPAQRRRWLGLAGHGAGQNGWRDWDSDKGVPVVLDEVLEDPSRMPALLAAVPRCGTVREVVGVVGALHG